MERKYRMYGLVPYNISPIQQGIQYGHAVVEYGLKYTGTPEYDRWSKVDKTFIILNGGTTNTNPFSLGTLNQHASALKMKYGIDTAEFYEPDLGDQLTAVVFLLDDRYWDREAYPEYEGEYASIGWLKQFDEDIRIAENIVAVRNWLSKLKLA